jgi:hypothetical protein
MSGSPRRRLAANRLRAGFVERLRDRRPEIEQAILTRVYAVSDSSGVGDYEYVEGLRAAVSAGVSYFLLTIEEGESEPGPIPGELFAQARKAALNAVSLDTVLRRYLASYTLFGDFVMQEAEETDLFGVEELQAVGKTQAMLFESLVEAVSAEYQRVAENRPPSLDLRRVRSVRRLLDGQLANTTELAYDLESWHLGAIAFGAGGQEAIRKLATALDRHLLCVCPYEGTFWTWLGGRRRADDEDFKLLAAASLPSGVSLAVGQPAQGLAGWRLTHRQAAASLPIALRSPRPVTCYADVALLASMLQDEVLIQSLYDVYLAPLAEDRDGGVNLRATLRAYFAAERNVSSAASALGVSRKTVTSRLRAAEERLGRSLGACAAEMEAALRLEQVADLAVIPALTPIGAELRRSGSKVVNWAI